MASCVPYVEIQTLYVVYLIAGDVPAVNSERMLYVGIGVVSVGSGLSPYPDYLAWLLDSFPSRTEK